MWGYPDVKVLRWCMPWAVGDFSVHDHSGRGRKPDFSPSGSCNHQSFGLRTRKLRLGLAISRQSLADVTSRVRQALGKPISGPAPCGGFWTVMRSSRGDSKYWIFPRDPDFAEKARRILDLYAGYWDGEPLGPKDYILSADEKTSIQARIRCHHSLPTSPGRAARVEFEYERGGTCSVLGGVGCATRIRDGAL